MKNTSITLKFFMNLAKTQFIMSRRFDGKLGGLGFNELMILYYLSQSREEKLRRVDLAEKAGLTASGITRMLLPMEKVGYVKREYAKEDARVSYVALAPGGKRRLAEGLERAEEFMEELISPDKSKKLENLSEVLAEIGGKV